MSVQFFGAPVLATFTPDTISHALHGINDNLVAAGWTSVGVGSQAQITIGSLPGNGSTYSVGGITYTFQTVLNNAVANNILIAANTTLQAQYIADAILAVSGGGTEWSTPTTANTVVTATSVTNTVVFNSIGTGTAANASFTVTSGFGSPVSQGNGFVCTSAVTPQGLQANAYIINTDQDQDSISIWWGSADGALQSGATVINGPNGGASGFFGSLVITGGRTLHIVASSAQFFTWLTGDKATKGCQVGMTIPYLRAGQTAVAISGVSNNGGLFEITTSTAHGALTGQSVSLFGITGTGGITAANNVWTITVIDATHYTLNGSTFAGTYASGGLQGGSGGAGSVSGISRCFVGWTDYSDTSALSGYQNTWRNFTGVQYGFLCINENSYGFNTSSRLVSLMFAQPTPIVAYYNWGGFANSQEALFGAPGTSVSAAYRGIGEFWGALIVVDSVPMDDTNTGYLGHNWINQTDFDGVASLWLATT
jgi:hypothetical protein